MFLKIDFGSVYDIFWYNPFFKDSKGEFQNISMTKSCTVYLISIKTHINEYKTFMPPGVHYSEKDPSNR